MIKREMKETISDYAMQRQIPRNCVIQTTKIENIEENKENLKKLRRYQARANICVHRIQELKESRKII